MDKLTPQTSRRLLTFAERFSWRAVCSNRMPFQVLGVKFVACYNRDINESKVFEFDQQLFAICWFFLCVF